MEGGEWRLPVGIWAAVSVVSIGAFVACDWDDFLWAAILQEHGGAIALVHNAALFLAVGVVGLGVWIGMGRVRPGEWHSLWADLRAYFLDALVFTMMINPRQAEAGRWEMARWIVGIGLLRAVGHLADARVRYWLQVGLDGVTKNAFRASVRLAALCHAVLLTCAALVLSLMSGAMGYSALCGWLVFELGAVGVVCWFALVRLTLCHHERALAYTWPAKNLACFCVQLAQSLVCGALLAGFFWRFLGNSYGRIPFVVAADGFNMFGSILSQLQTLLQYRRITRGLHRFVKPTADQIKQQAMCIVCRDSLVSVEEEVDPLGAPDPLVTEPVGAEVDTKVNDQEIGSNPAGGLQAHGAQINVDGGPHAKEEPGLHPNPVEGETKVQPSVVGMNLDNVGKVDKGAALSTHRDEHAKVGALPGDGHHSHRAHHNVLHNLNVLETPLEHMLKQHALGTDSSSSESESDSDDEEEVARLIRLACGHIFHRPCLTSWIIKRGECPTCRAVIKAPVEVAEETTAGESGTPGQAPGRAGVTPSAPSDGTSRPTSSRLDCTSDVGEEPRAQNPTGADANDRHGPFAARAPRAHATLLRQRHAPDCAHTWGGALLRAALPHPLRGGATPHLGRALCPGAWDEAGYKENACFRDNLYVQEAYRDIPRLLAQQRMQLQRKIQEMMGGVYVADPTG